MFGFLLTLFLLTAYSAGYPHTEESDQNCEAKQNEAWSYGGGNGPQNWGENFPMCNNAMQSPINIRMFDVSFNAKLHSLQFLNYSVPVAKADIVNNGHTVQITPKDDVTRSIRIGNPPTLYTLQQLHFHWGSRKSQGSEHSIDGRFYPMEMHLVHLSETGEYAVVGVFFQEYRKPNNQNMEPIVKALNNVKYDGDRSTLSSPLNLVRLLPRESDYYYRYQGSLTTPPCSEGVIWSVLKRHVLIGTHQMNVFRNLSAIEKSESEDEQCSLADNYRPIQPLNGRTVESTYGF